MKLVLSTCILLLFGNIFASAQDVTENMEVKKYFLITASSKDYNSALTSAKFIAEQLELELNLRDLRPDKEAGLTWSKKECEENGWDAPCYVARGRYDDGKYVSIEWSDAYSGFSKGYYIVIVASQPEKNEALTTFLSQVRQHVTSAYLKSALVYLGCMH